MSPIRPRGWTPEFLLETVRAVPPATALAGTSAHHDRTPRPGPLERNNKSSSAAAIATMTHTYGAMAFDSFLEHSLERPLAPSPDTQQPGGRRRFAPAKRRERSSEGGERMEEINDPIDRTSTDRDPAEALRAKASEVEHTVQAAALADNVPRAGSAAANAVRDAWRRVLGSARDEPVAAFLAGAVAGLILGLLIPVTRTETEKLAAAAEEIEDRAAEVGERVLDRGAEMADRAAEKVTEAVEGVGSGSGSDVSTLPPPATPSMSGDAAIEQPGGFGLPGRPMPAPNFVARK